MADKSTTGTPSAPEGTVRVYLNHSVGHQGGPLYGPGWANVPKALADSIALSPTNLAGPASESSDAQPSDGQSSGDEQSAVSERKPATKFATKTALREYGDAGALRTLAATHGIEVGEDATKAELVDALHAADISLES